MANNWDRIIAARAARSEQIDEVEIEEISALNLIEAILQERPGNFRTVFEQLMQDRLQDLVAEAKQAYASSLLGEQEVPDADDEEDWEDDDDDDDRELEEIPDEEELDDDKEIEEVRLVNKSLKERMIERRRLKEEGGHLRGHGTTLPGGEGKNGHLPGPAGQKNKQPGQIGTRPKLYLAGVQKLDKTNTGAKQAPLGHASGPGNVYDKTLSRLKSMSGKLASHDKGR